MTAQKSTYQPQPGTIAFRAYAWLQAQPADIDVTASMWAEAINVEPTSLVPCLDALLKAGLVRAFTKHGLTRPKWYRLGEGTPERPLREDDEDEGPQVVQRIVPAHTAPPMVLAAGEVPTFLPTVRGDGLTSEAAPAAQMQESAAPAPCGHPEPPEIRPAKETESENLPATPVPFNVWLSGITGEMVLQGLELDADGDAVLTREQVLAVRALLTGEAPA